MTALGLRLIAYAVALLALIGASVWVGAHFTAQHYEVLISKENSARDALASAAAQKAKADQDAADARNRQVQDGLQTTLVAITGNRDDLARRLHNAIQASGSHLPQGPGGSLPPAAPGSQGNEVLAGLLSDALTEANANYARCDALITELKPQL